MALPRGRMVTCSMGGRPGVRAKATARAASMVAYRRLAGVSGSGACGSPRRTCSGEGAAATVSDSGDREPIKQVVGECLRYHRAPEAPEAMARHAPAWLGAGHCNRRVGTDGAAEARAVQAGGWEYPAGGRGWQLHLVHGLLEDGQPNHRHLLPDLHRTAAKGGW